PGAEQRGPACAPVGLGTFIGQALSKAQLKPEQQQAIGQLGDENATIEAELVKARNGLLQSFAEQLEAPQMNPAPIGQAAQAFTDAQTKARPMLYEQLGKLHAILEPAQRDQFVQAMHEAISSFASQASPEKVAEQLHLTPQQSKQLSGALGSQASGAAQ